MASWPPPTHAPPTTHPATAWPGLVTDLPPAQLAAPAHAGQATTPPQPAEPQVVPPACAPHQAALGAAAPSAAARQSAVEGTSAAVVVPAVLRGPAPRAIVADTSPLGGMLVTVSNTLGGMLGTLTGSGGSQGTSSAGVTPEQAGPLQITGVGGPTTITLPPLVNSSGSPAPTGSAVGNPPPPTGAGGSSASSSSPTSGPSTATGQSTAPAPSAPSTPPPPVAGPTAGGQALVPSTPFDADVGCELIGLGSVGTVAPGETAVQAAAVNGALALLGTPYVWGGESTHGFDCSGLVQYVYANAGLWLPRVAQAQYDAGPAVPPGHPVVPGDLVFFGSGPHDVTHVGIFVGDGLMVDAPHTGAVVRLDRVLGFEPIVGVTAPGGQVA